METDKLTDLSEKLRSGSISGKELAEMVESGVITKGERRKISKLSKCEAAELSKRQLQRIATNEKKKLPKLTKEDRKRKYVTEKLENQRDMEKGKTTVCLHCRQKGHLMKYCQELVNQSKLCFNCGSQDHSLHQCPVPRTGSSLPYSTCFICKQRGHLSRDCPSNDHGLYPQGGCCHICLRTDHLVKDCPEKEKKSTDQKKAEPIAPSNWKQSDAVGGDDLVEYNESTKLRKKRRSKI